MIETKQLLVLCLISLCVAKGSCQWNSTCAKIIKKSSDCFLNSVVLGREVYKLPRTVQQLDAQVCGPLPKDLKCIMRVRRCLKPFQRTFFSFAMKSVTSEIESTFCGPIDKKQNLLDSLACVQGEEDIRKMFRVLDKTTAIIDHLVEATPLESLLPNMCCGLIKLVLEVESYLNDLCPNGNLSRTFLDMMKSLFGDAVDIGCAGYDSIEICTDKLPDLVGKLTEVWKGTIGRYKHSPIIPMLSMLSKLDKKIDFSAS